MSEDKEKDLMSMYRKTRPRVFFGGKSNANHLAWSLLTMLLALAFWLVVALSAVENQRYALQARACQDRVFPAEIDMSCLKQVKSREYWQQQVGHALLKMGA